MLRTLYVTYVRPQLEYGAVIWNPYNKEDINRLERVQARATKLVHQLRHLDYETRLAQLNLLKLEERR